MFGKNAITKSTQEQSGATLAVHSVFLTLQGEGPDAGSPAVFVRLQGCNLRCHFCDTEFETGKTWSVADLVLHIESMIADAGINPAGMLLVITGGEPLLQNFALFAAAMIAQGFYVSVETAGSINPSDDVQQMFRSGDDIRFVVSPKTGKLGSWFNRNHEELGNISYKYIIEAGKESAHDGLPCFTTQGKGLNPCTLHRPTITSVRWRRRFVYVQPMDVYCIDDPTKRDVERYQQNVDACVRIAQKFGYRVSLQTHKILGVE